VGEFKSKIELAQECIEEAMKFFDIDYVVFDSWYTTKDFIRFIEDRGLKWVGQFNGLLLKFQRICHFKYCEL
jgi:hypothetical protein